MSERYNTYVGCRYVPIFDGTWDNTKKYEPLTIVEYQGDSYTSKTYVPIGADITNQTYWAKTGSYNAQIEQLSQEVAADHARVDQCENDVADLADTVAGYDQQFVTINNHLTTIDGNISGLDARITSEVATLNNTITTGDATLDAKIDTEVARIDGEISDINDEIDILKGSKGFVTPEQFGAVGDGVADDATAVNQCFAYAAQNDLIVLGTKKYLFDMAQQLVINGGVTAINLHLIFTATNTYANKVFVMNEKPYHFINCIFEEDQVRANSHGFFCWRNPDDIHDQWVANYGDIILEHCKIINVSAYAIWCSSTYDNTFYVSDCIFENIDGTGILTENRNLVVENSSFMSSNNQPFVNLLSHEMVSGSENTLRNVTLNNCTTNQKLLEINQDYRSNFDTVMITGCIDTNSSINNKSIYSTGDDNHFSEFKRLIVDNSSLNTIDINFLYSSSGSRSGVEFKNSHIGKIAVATETSIIISGCELGFVESTTNKNIIIQGCYFYLGTSGSITTYLKPWMASTQKIKNIFLNDVIFDTNGMHTGALIEDVAVEKVICNGISFRDEDASMQFMDNTSQVLTSYLYMDGVQSMELRTSGKYFVKGVTGVIIRGIGDSGSFTISGASRQKVETTWFSA